MLPAAAICTSGSRSRSNLESVDSVSEAPTTPKSLAPNVRTRGLGSREAITPRSASRMGGGLKILQAAMAAIEKACPDARAIALVPENHTRNQFYLQNVEKLARILRHAGVEVRIVDEQRRHAFGCAARCAPRPTRPHSRTRRATAHIPSRTPRQTPARPTPQSSTPVQPSSW
jgi:hypothetical protein